MPKLKNAVITKILSRLDNGEFCQEDFLIDFPDTDVLAKITFRSMTKYSFIIDETDVSSLIPFGVISSSNSSIKKEIRTIERPGSYKNSDSKTHENISDAIDRIYAWKVNVREDIIHSKRTIRKTLDSMNEEFQNSIDKNISDPENFFKPNEIEKLKVKLDELKTRVEGLKGKYGVSSDNIKTLESAIDKSKKDLKIYPKGIWYKTSGNKILKIMRMILNSKEGKRVLADIAKKLFIN